MNTNRQTFRFKTNIKCEGCIANVKPLLDKVEGITHWEVDTEAKEKTLTIESATTTKEQVIAAVQKAGYTIEILN